MPDTISEVSPYPCKISGATFTHKCSVSSCFAHIHNLNKCKVEVEPVTNCAHIDFALHGFSESISYAVEEQGFVGYRDLQYIAPFLQVNAIKLRDIYNENVELFRKTVSLLWLLKSNPPDEKFCCLCGHPIGSSRIQCVSTSACAERSTVLKKTLGPIQSILSDDELPQVFNIIWRSFTENFIIKIPLTEEDKQNLKELRISCS